MDTYVIAQNYDNYTEQDHETWRILCKKQSELQNNKIAKQYLDGFNQLKIDKTKIVRIEEVSKILESISGWTLIPVSGLLPTKDFFYMLINKRYPVTVPIRKPHELDFSEQPDIFHDICGHLPLLTNEKFTKFITAYSIIAMKYINHEKAIDFLGRLYWFTYEMGLIVEEGKHKPYGGAVMTSAEEIANVYLESTPIHPFNLDHIFHTEFSPFKLQKEYFTINSFDDLFNCLENLESKLVEHLLLPKQDTILNYSLNSNLGEGFNNIIGFLNDVQSKFPKAISFVAGQPDENFFEIENQISQFSVFVDYIVKRTGENRQDIIKKIGQYSNTKGIICNIISKYLDIDENIKVSEESVLITSGAQEAFSIIVSTICNANNDVVLIEDPSYIGITSFSKMFNYQINGVKIDDDGIDLNHLKDKILEVNRSNKRVKLLYVIPDFQNPTGSCMPIGNRLKLLELAQKYNFLIIEDSVYNNFTYAQKKNPTLKSLDKYGRVIYVGSFSKSLFPGLRVGMIVADQKIEDEMGKTIFLIDEMAKVKALLSNNTSTISQAILGGVLLSLNFSLNEWSKPKHESYKEKQLIMIDVLEKYIGKFKSTWAKEISWNKPEGGFFIKMSVPFNINDKSVYESGSKYNVIFCPMHYFYLDKGGEQEIRLSFSNLPIEAIEFGVKQLANYLKEKIEKSESKLIN